MKNINFLLLLFFIVSSVLIFALTSELFSETKYYLIDDYPKEWIKSEITRGIYYAYVDAGNRSKLKTEFIPNYLLGLIVASGYLSFCILITIIITSKKRTPTNISSSHLIKQ
jgi:hypothetical protein